jgi:hypothetical protein
VMAPEVLLGLAAVTAPLWLGALALWLVLAKPWRRSKPVPHCDNCVESKPDVMVIEGWDGNGPIHLCLGCLGLLVPRRLAREEGGERGRVQRLVP